MFKLEKAHEESLDHLRRFVKRECRSGFKGTELFAYLPKDDHQLSDLISLYDYKGLEDPAPPWLTWPLEHFSSCFKRDTQVFPLPLCLLIPCDLTCASLTRKLAQCSKKSIVGALTTKGQSLSPSSLRSFRFWLSLRFTMSKEHRKDWAWQRDSHSHLHLPSCCVREPTRARFLQQL